MVLFARGLAPDAAAECRDVLVEVVDAGSDRVEPGVHFCAESADRCIHLCAESVEAAIHLAAQSIDRCGHGAGEQSRHDGHSAEHERGKEPDEHPALWCGHGGQLPSVRTVRRQRPRVGKVRRLGSVGAARQPEC